MVLLAAGADEASVPYPPEHPSTALWLVSCCLSAALRHDEYVHQRALLGLKPLMDDFLLQ